MGNPNTLENYTIVVIEDDTLVNSTIRSILTQKYSRVETFTDSMEAQEELANINPDLILLDIFLGHENGLDLLEKFRKQGLNMPVIMMTAFSDIKMAVRAMKLGAEDFIVKPLDLEQLEISIEKALDNLQTRRQVQFLSEQLKEDRPSEILGNSDEMRRALEMAKMYSKADDTTVLILGESGTGKELTASYIHDNSARKKGAFVTINCGAIPKELAESELFGHEKGAFTGAHDRRIGRFEQANNGTILLDEVGELSLDLQVKLLRVLQERKFFRLGGSKEITVNVRVIAATNKDLEKLIAEEKFREDLFYRLNVATITLPPLRDRGNDVISLATAFVNRFNKKFGKSITGFTKEANEILLMYKWKGNIRELMNVIERVVLLETSTVISKDSLDFLKIDGIKEVINSTSPTGVKQVIEIEEGNHILKISSNGVGYGDVVKDLIIQTLKISNGNQIQAAKILGISRAKLRYRMEQLGINVSGKIIS